MTGAVQKDRQRVPIDLKSKKIPQGKKNGNDALAPAKDKIRLTAICQKIRTPEKDIT